ncbi:class I SAM-dependent methyltransferase [Thermodesulfobacteriota bacterium]
MSLQPRKCVKKNYQYLFAGLLFITLIITIFTCPAVARSGKANFSDSSGEEYSKESDNLDVPYLPTPMELVRKILNLGSVGPRDFLIDLGSGDGRIVITAAKEYGARGIGVDLNEKLVALSKKYAVAEGVEEKTSFFVQDVFKTDIKDATIVTLYLLKDVNLQLRPKLLAELKPGTRVISHDFHMGEWRPDKILFLNVLKPYQDYTILYLWIVPSMAAGTWHWKFILMNEAHTFDLVLDQSYQDISGVVRNRGYDWRIFDASMEGDRIQFSLVGEADVQMIRQDYKGRVQGNSINGTMEYDTTVGKVSLKWRATRGN